jgi:hypothetical protein
MSCKKQLILAIFVAVAFTSPRAQSLHDKIQARAAESGKPRDVPGGTTFSVPMPADRAFDAVVKYFQIHDSAIDESSKKELGQLITAMKIVDVGGFRNNNKGYRTYVTFIHDSDSSTTVKVKVTIQQRSNHGQPDPWSEPKILDKETADTTAELKAALGAS